MLRVRRALVLVLAGVSFGAGCGGDDAPSEAGSEPVREQTLHLRAEERGDEYTFVAEGVVDLRVGDRVTFEVRNAGLLPHDLQVVHPDGHAIGTAPVAAPGGVISVVVDLEDPGYYRLNCLVGDHLTRYGMQAIVEVKEAGV